MPRGDSSQRNTAENVSQGAGARPRKRKWYGVLLLPFVGLLYMPFYARAEPRLWGFPFFYWYQFLWIFLTIFLIELVHRKTR